MPKQNQGKFYTIVYIKEKHTNYIAIATQYCKIKFNEIKKKLKVFLIDFSEKKKKLNAKDINYSTFL